MSEVRNRYSGTWGTSTPGLAVFLLDRSGSMGERYAADPSKTKAQRLAEIVNETISEMVQRCTTRDGIRNRCSIALLGYHQPQHDRIVVESLWGGGLAGRTIVPITEVNANPLRMDIVRKEVVPGETIEVETSIWLEPGYGGGTPMWSALKRVRDIIAEWLGEPEEGGKWDAFPPVVFHITDGQSTEPSDSKEREKVLRDAANAIKELSNNNGNVLLINCHIPGEDIGLTQVLAFPTSKDLPANPYAQLLFDMSSEFPTELLDRAMGAGLSVSEGSRLMMLNASLERVLSLIVFMTMTALR